MSGAAVIHRYYQCVNARQFAEAAALISQDCEFVHATTREHAHGPRGFRALINDWLKAVPDLVFAADSIEELADGSFSVGLSLRGHFKGEMIFGAAVVSGTGQPFAVHGTHRLRIRDGQIVRSEFTFDPGELLRLA